MQRPPAIVLLSLALALGACSPVTTKATDADTTPQPRCDQYCELIMENCVGFEQYTSLESCNAHCEDFASIPLGEVGDSSGHSVACRTVHAGIAKTSGIPETHCPHSGVTGGNVCGSWCENYCHLAEVNCSSAPLYGSNEECMSVCANIDDSGLSTDTSGDSIQCRIHFLTQAGTEGDISAAAECPKGALQSAACVVP